MGRRTGNAGTDRTVPYDGVGDAGRRAPASAPAVGAGLGIAPVPPLVAPRGVLGAAVCATVTFRTAGAGRAASCADPPEPPPMNRAVIAFGVLTPVVVAIGVAPLRANRPRARSRPSPRSHRAS
ncbi:hypothetical protein ACFCX0_34715 [Streptomyces sp. NPDC056352]|uniref:hypothetical protein n=1 Tax=Streptomyces sp. NPDC056352 TaxID=3345791 RepID=UPI0035DC938E